MISKTNTSILHVLLEKVDETLEQISHTFYITFCTVIENKWFLAGTPSRIPEGPWTPHWETVLRAINHALPSVRNARWTYFYFVYATLHLNYSPSFCWKCVLSSTLNFFWGVTCEIDPEAQFFFDSLRSVAPPDVNTFDQHHGLGESPSPEENLFQKEFPVV